MCHLDKQQFNFGSFYDGRALANFILEVKNNVEFWNKILFSNEAHFHFGGYVNNQNCRFCEMEPLFHENDDGETVNVNGERYRYMIRDILWPQ